MSDERLNELWEQAEDLEPGPAQVALFEEAIREADRISNDHASFYLRKQLMESAAFSGAGEKLLVAFSWCLGKVDEQPEDFDEQDILWEYKWAISHAIDFPQVGRPQIENMLADFERRLNAIGYSVRPANYLRMLYCYDTGLLEEAQQLALKWPKQPRADGYADCEACEADNQVDLLVRLGKHAEAFEVAKPLLSGRLSCAEVPHRTLSTLLLSALAQGDEPLAQRLQRRGYKMIYRDPDFLRPLGMHALYFARRSQAAKGVDLIEKHLPWAMQTMELRTQLDFYVGCLALARSLGDQAVKIALPSDHPLASASGEVQPPALLGWFQAEVDRLRELFDQRNGNDYQSQQVQAWLALAAA